MKKIVEINQWKKKIRLYLATNGNDVSSVSVMQALIKEYLRTSPPDDAKLPLLSNTFFTSTDEEMHSFCARLIDESLLK